jgi:hypothetical protein
MAMGEANTDGTNADGRTERTYLPPVPARPLYGKREETSPHLLRLGLKLSEMSDLPQSDVSRPSKLPTANLLPQGLAPPAVEQTSAEYLEAVEEEWNKRVDVEIETLADGMVDLVNLASVSHHWIFPPRSC